MCEQSGEKSVIGVNRFVADETVHDIETHPTIPKPRSAGFCAPGAFAPSGTRQNTKV